MGGSAGSTQYASFLVRLWRDSEQEAACFTATWRGELEHIQTNQRLTFDSLEELLRLLHQQLVEANRR